MKTYEELTSEILTKAKAEKKARRKRAIMASSSIASVALVLTVSLVIAQFAGAFSSKDIIYEQGDRVEVASAKDYEEIYDHLVIERTTALDKFIDRISGLFGIVSEGFDQDKSMSAQIEENAARPMDIGIDDGLNFTAEDSFREAEATLEAGESEDHSDTNIQVEGIMEADVVKTDGDYIYVLSFNKLYIISVEDGVMAKVCETEFFSEDDVTWATKPEIANEIAMSTANTADMYVYGDRLVILYSTSEGSSWYDSYCHVAFYDITDRTSPELEKTLGMSGEYLSSRMEGGILYLMSSDRFRSNEIDKDNPETYVPTELIDGKEQIVDIDSIYFDMDEAECSYLNICTYDVKECESVSRISLLDYGSAEIYQSAEHIFAAKATEPAVSKDNIYKSRTIIAKVSLGEELSLAATGVVNGTVLNSFSMDEYNGYFRLVTTVDYVVVSTSHENRYYTESSGTHNNLYILDQELNIAGSIEKLAEDEKIYSARFDGDIAYFVTYRETDPLFCADLSDPENPKILSELKIPGFSDYLHKYTDDLLLGLGENGQGSVKISMFNISDKTNVTEESVSILYDQFFSEVSQDHHAILVDSQKNLIAFPGTTEYFVYSYCYEEFVQNARLPLDRGYFMSSSWTGRSLYIGDYLFICTPYSVRSYSLIDYTEVWSVTLMDINYNPYIK